MIRRLSLIALAGLVACSPEPRGAAYFEARREEAARIVAACKTGAHRGAECVNAEAGAKAGARDARMDSYRKNF